MARRFFAPESYGAAVHEAGHVVVGLAVGLRVRKVTAKGHDGSTAFEPERPQLIVGGLHDLEPGYSRWPRLVVR